MRKIIFLLAFLGLFSFNCPTYAVTIDQTNNLLENGSFESGSFDPISGHNVQSAADYWRQWINGGTTLTSELITNEEMLNDFGVEVVDGNAAFRITANGASSGGYTFESYHDPGWNTNATLTLSGWIYVITGQAGLWNGSNQDGFTRSVSSTTGEWEFLSVTIPGNRINDEPLLYSVGGASDFIVDSIWLNYGEYSLHPGAPVPEPSTMMLFGLGLIGLARINRRKK